MITFNEMPSGEGEATWEEFCIHNTIEDFINLSMQYGYGNMLLRLDARMVEVENTMKEPLETIEDCPPMTEFKFQTYGVYEDENGNTKIGAVE